MFDCLLSFLLLLLQIAAAQYLNAPRLYKIEAVGREPNSQGERQTTKGEKKKKSETFSDSRAVLGGDGYSADNQYFAPAQVTIYAGDSVLWFWSKGTHNVVQVHNATSVVALRDTHRDLDGFGLPPTEKGTFFWTFAEPGEYHFICEPHIYCCQMRGVVRVVPRPASMALVPAFGGSASASASGAAAMVTVAPATHSFLDNLVLGGESHATDVIDGARAPVTAAMIISDSHFVNGDDAEHRVTIEVIGSGNGRTRFNRVAFFLTLVALGVVLLLFIFCWVRRRAPPAPQHSGKARVVLHAPPPRFDMPL